MTIELVLLSRVAYRGQEITGSARRGLLALLAGDLRTGCGTARLVDSLWADGPPEHPVKALQLLVSRTRARLGPDVILSTPTGYRLALGEGQVDASAVLLSASASERCAREGEHTSALEHAEAGLALCEGATGWDVADDDPLSALRAARLPAYRSLARGRALALSRLGRHAEAVEPLRGLAAERDEEVLVELLRSEAATVGPATALASYDAYRRALREELGSDPGPELRSVHRELLLTDAPVVRHGVRQEPNPMLGRDKDVAAVADLLRTSRVTSVVGAGGLGKTRLAHAVSRDAEQRVVHFVELAGVTAGGDVAGEVASALGVREAGPGPLAVRANALTGIVDALEPGPALLVLDNCEHVVHEVAELVATLVSMSRTLRVLTTGRAPLGLSSESVYPLPELDLPTMIELFGQRARAIRPDINLPPAVVRNLCGRLDGLPLAVELAAARVRVMSVAEIVAHLDDRFALLRGSTRDVPARHHTLHAVIDWSWHLLEPAGQAAMRALSVFPGGFTAAAARHVLGDDAVLAQLVDQSLLRVADSGSGTRFRMLETVREFSTARREDAGETDRAIDRFLAWASDFGARWPQSDLVSGFAAVDAIRAEQDNLLQALRYGVDREDGATVAVTAALLSSLWVTESNFTRLEALARDIAWVLSHARPAPALVEATRTAAVVGAMIAFIMPDLSPLRALVALRRLPQAPSDTLIRAAHVALCAPDVSALHEFSGSDEPLLAGVANYVLSYLWENTGDRDGALRAARRTARRCCVPWPTAGSASCACRSTRERRRSATCTRRCRSWSCSGGPARPRGGTHWCWPTCNTARSTRRNVGWPRYGTAGTNAARPWCSRSAPRPRSCSAGVTSRAACACGGRPRTVSSTPTCPDCAPSRSRPSPWSPMPASAGSTWSPRSSMRCRASCPPRSPRRRWRSSRSAARCCWRWPWRTSTAAPPPGVSGRSPWLSVSGCLASSSPPCPPSGSRPSPSGPTGRRTTTRCRCTPASITTA